MTDYPTDQFRAVESEASRRVRLSHYIFNSPALKKRVQAALFNLQDALYIWNRVAGRPYFPFSAVIRQDKLANCRVFNHRSTLLQSLGPFERTMEIGVLQGAFSLEIIQALRPRQHTMIDINTEAIDRSLFAGLPTELEVLTGRSQEILPTLPAATWDFIYIDGGHDEASVRSDLEQSARLTRDGGIIMLNDYCNWSPNQGVPYGVMPAVNGFLNDSAFAMTGIAIDGTGAFDVALQRRG